MTDPTSAPDPLDIIPDPTEVRRRLGATYRMARILRGLLRIAERRAEHDQMTARPTDSKGEGTRHD